MFLCYDGRAVGLVLRPGRVAGTFLVECTSRVRGDYHVVGLVYVWGLGRAVALGGEGA